MKSTLAPGDSISKQIEVNEERCISFMGPENAVYATPRMVSDMEYTCRDLLLRHLDEGEDSVGAHVSIDHLAATPLGMLVTIERRSPKSTAAASHLKSSRATSWRNAAAPSTCASSSTSVRAWNASPRKE